MAAVPALVRFDYPLFPALASTPQPAPAASSEKLQESLKTLFPDLMVHGTRSYLLNVTTALTKAGNRSHQYFGRVSNILAFERMMREFMQLTAAVSPFPMNFAAANCWNGMFMPGQSAPSPWAFPSTTAQPANPALSFLSGGFQPQQPASNPMQFWGTPAPAQPANPMSLFAGAFQPQSAAARQAAPWSDYNALSFVPMAFLAAAPMPESWWNFGF
jgi:hypothetical protein